ncbi:unnamed protein product [Amoebophrya sp. A25]|nr:unnamed protein product [Amoebophrya sp. A25]|eukprot:GSA25T00003997001.1
MATEKKFLSSCSMVNQDKQKEFEAEVLRFRKSAEQCLENRNKVLPRIMEYFEAYTDKYRITILAPIALPPDYYHGFVERNPITGALVLAGVEKQFDFWFVDLFDRDVVCDNPENLEKDPFLFKATVLPMRTWIMQRLVQQLEAARQGYSSVLGVTFNDDKVVHATVRDDCAALALGQAVQMGHTYNSPFQALMYITFVCAFSKSLGLIIYTCFISCISLYVAQAFSVPVLFRFTRVVDILLRSVYVILLFTAVAEVGLSSLGDALGVLAILAVFCMMLFDMLRGDLGTWMTYSTETKYEILKQLGDRVWICHLVPARQKRDNGPKGAAKYSSSQPGMMSKTMKAGMTMFDSDADDRPLSNLVTGELPPGINEEQALLIVDVNGMLCQLTPLDARTVDYVENVRRAIEGRPEKHSDITLYKRTYRRPAPAMIPDTSMPARQDDGEPVDAAAAVRQHMEKKKAGQKVDFVKEGAHSTEDVASGRASPSSSREDGDEDLTSSIGDSAAGHLSTPTSSRGASLEELEFSVFEDESDLQEFRAEAEASTIVESSKGSGCGSRVDDEVKDQEEEDDEFEGEEEEMDEMEPIDSADIDDFYLKHQLASLEGGSSSSSSSSGNPDGLWQDGVVVAEQVDATAGGILLEGQHKAPNGNGGGGGTKGGGGKRGGKSVVDVVPSRKKKKGVYGDGQLPDVTLCGLRHEILAEDDAAPVSNSLKSMDDGSNLWRVAAKRRKVSLAPPYEPMMLSIVNIPIYNRNYPSQVHKETLFRLQAKSRKSQAEPPPE